MKIDKNLRKVKGIYKITNIVNKKCYIGSSIDVYQRGCTYKHLIKRKKLHNNHLQSSVNKYGYEAFIFECIKICSNDISIVDLHKIEQKYINDLKPQYNKRHVVDTNHLLQHSQKTKNKISKNLKAIYKSGLKVNSRIQDHNIEVSVFNLKGILIQDFKGLSFCADFLNVKYQSVTYAINSKRHRIKNFIVLKKEDKHLIQTFLKIPKTIPYSKKVRILDIVSNEIIEFKTIKDAALFIKCKVDTLNIYNNTKKIWKKKYQIISIH